MPEEINRVVTDTLSTVLFCPSDNAVANLAREGIHRGVHNVGDVMCGRAEHVRPATFRSIDTRAGRRYAA